MNIYGKMMVVAGVAMLAACQNHGAGSSENAQPVDPELDRCQASQYQSYVGKPLSSISSLSFANPVRAIPENSAVTMDFNLNRINFLGDKDNNITRVYCG